jgi:hypothetical protein
VGVAAKHVRLCDLITGLGTNLSKRCTSSTLESRRGSCALARLEISSGDWDLNAGVAAVHVRLCVLNLAVTIAGLGRSKRET